MSFHIGEEISKEEFLSVFSEKIKQVKSDTFIINSFIQFQYGELSESNNAHKSVINKLRNLAPHEPLTWTTSGDMDKEEDKDKEQDKVKDKEKVQEFFNFWNSAVTEKNGVIIKLPQAKSLSKPRIKKIKTRLTEPTFDFKKAIPMILESDFLLGVDGGWRADLDWLIENENNIVKVLEGKYANKSKALVAQPLTDHIRSQYQRFVLNKPPGEIV